MINSWSGRIDPDCSSSKDGKDVSNSSGKEMGLPTYQMRKSIAFDEGKENRRHINAEFTGKIMWSVTISISILLEN